MKLNEIAKMIEERAPKKLACSWDNVGLLLGRGDADITKAVTALDLDIETAMYAKETGAQLVVTHHPVMFEAINKINDTTPEGRCILYMLENKIALYSAHTNLDAAEGGTNDFLAGLYGMEDVTPFEITYTDENGKSYGLGRKGRLAGKVTLKALARTVAEKLGIYDISYIGDAEKPINTVSICSGGGGSMINPGIDTDVYITGDVKYSNARNAAAQDLAVIIAPHYNTEIFAADILKNMIRGVEVEAYKNKNVEKSLHIDQ